MKAFIIILLAFLIPVISYIAYMNLNEAGYFSTYNYKNPEAEHFVQTTIKTSDTFISKDESSNAFLIESSDGKTVNLKADKKGVQEFFKNWTVVNGDLQAPKDCLYINIVTDIKHTGVQDLNDIFERIYCTTTINPNLIQL